MSVSLRLAGIASDSIVDGPGLRYTIFCQGCVHHCEGCHNPETWDFDAGYDLDIETILKEIDENPLLDGVTFSGGDPVLQAEPFSILAAKVKARNLNVVLYTGFTYEQLIEMSQNDENVSSLLKNTDLLVDGRFEFSLRDLTLPFRGSSNQRIIDMNKTRESGVLVLDPRYHA